MTNITSASEIAEAIRNFAAAEPTIESTYSLIDNKRDNPKLKYISEALAFRELMQLTGHWVHLLKDHNRVDITYGRIMSNGLREAAISTRTYYMYAGRVEYIVTSHL